MPKRAAVETDTPGGRLKEARESLKLNQTLFGEPLGFSISILGKLERGETKLTLSHAQSIENIHKIPAKWLLDGEGEKPVYNEKVPPISNVRPVRGGVVAVPVFSKLTAVCGGKGFVLEDVQSEIAWWEPIPESWLNGYPTGPSPVYVTYIEGNSMEPLIEDGERILINPNMEVKHGDVAVLTWNGRRMVRGIKLERDGSVRLCPVNKAEYEEDLITNEDKEFVLQFEGVVMRFLGKDRVSRGIL